MSKKFLTIFGIAFFALFASCMFGFGEHDFAQEVPYTNQSFDGLFTMEFPLGKEYADISSNWSSGSLGSSREYVVNNSDGNFRQGDINVYYYNTSLLNGNESDLTDHVLGELTATYSYQINQNKDIIILQNDNDMCEIPFFLVGKSSADKREIVFVGGEDLNELTVYADTIEFSNK